MSGPLEDVIAKLTSSLPPPPPFFPSSSFPPSSLPPSLPPFSPSLSPPHQLILGDDDLSVIEALAKVCKDHHAELASTLIHTFCHYNRVIPIMTACITKSIRNEGVSDNRTFQLFQAIAGLSPSLQSWLKNEC